MKNLSALTAFFVTFLFVVYLGVFAGLQVNGFIAGKKLVAVSNTPVALASVIPVPVKKPQTKVIQTRPTIDTSTPASIESTPVPARNASPSDAGGPIMEPTPAPVVVDTSTPVPAPSVPPPTAPPADRCIITLSGGSYDVTDYRNIHSGGNVFQCGTDMTAGFLNRHPASFLQKMAQYKI